MPRLKPQRSMPKANRRVQHILRVVAKARKASGILASGYSIMLPFSRRLTSNSANKIGTSTRPSVYQFEK